MSSNGRTINPADWGPVLVIFPTQDLARYSDFIKSISGLRTPPGSRVKYSKGASIVQNLNRAVQDAIKEGFAWEWLFVIGDDHTFPPETLLRLLETGKTIVAPFVARRGPFTPVIFHDRGDQPYEDHGGAIYPAFEPYTLEEVEQLGPGLHPVDAVGSAGILIHRDIIDQLGYPYWVASSGSFLNEDLLFCRRAAELGYQTWVDTRITMGHMGQFNVEPAWDDTGRLRMILDFPGAEKVVLEHERRIIIERGDDLTVARR